MREAARVARLEECRKDAECAVDAFSRDGDVQALRTEGPYHSALIGLRLSQRGAGVSHRVRHSVQVVDHDNVIRS